MRNYKLRNKMVTDLNYYKYKYSDKFYMASEVTYRWFSQLLQSLQYSLQLSVAFPSAHDNFYMVGGLFC